MTNVQYIQSNLRFQSKRMAHGTHASLTVIGSNVSTLSVSSEVINMQTVNIRQLKTYPSSVLAAARADGMVVV